MTVSFADLPGYVPGGVVQGGADVRRGEFPAFDDGMMRGWIRARAAMLADVVLGDRTPDEYRATVAQFRARWGEQINKRVNDLAVCVTQNGGE